MKVSIVIPTYNEEKYLPVLLDSIKKQNFKDYEIIVADANSKDKTAEIAKKYNARIVKGGLPAAGRNNGAKAANGEIIFFLDADVKLISKNFIKNVYNEMKKHNLELATCEFIPMSKLLIDKIMHNFANTFIKLYQTSNPHAPGFCIFVSKKLFDKIKGFDETIRIAEDHDFVKRASKFRCLGIIESAKIQVSVRRMEKEGRFNLIGKYLHVDLYRAFKGEIRKDLVDYEFGNFEKKETKTLKEKLKQLDKLLKNINSEYKKLIKKKN